MSEFESSSPVTAELSESAARRERMRRIFTELLVATLFQGTPEQARELLDKQPVSDQPERP